MCGEYAAISGLSLAHQQECVGQDAANRAKVGLERVNEGLDENLGFLSRKKEQVARMEQDERERQKRDNSLQVEIHEMQILEKKKRALMLEKQIKEEEVRIVEQEREMGVVVDLVKSKMREQIAKTVLDFHKTDPVNY